MFDCPFSPTRSVKSIQALYFFINNLPISPIWEDPVHLEIYEVIGDIADETANTLYDRDLIPIEDTDQSLTSTLRSAKLNE